MEQEVSDKLTPISYSTQWTNRFVRMIFNELMLNSKLFNKVLQLPFNIVAILMRESLT